MSCEPWFAIMFAFSNPSEIMGRSVHEVIPSLQLPTGAARLREVGGEGRCVCVCVCV